ncbi:MAG: methionyl-tRNA formyltransferase [Deinococcales bacterium]
MRLAFFGSPAFALPSLDLLHQDHEICLVVAQPDKPAGRGNKLSSPAVALWAKEHNIPLAQPRRLKGNLAFAEQLEELKLDAAITAAYGKILPKNLLDIPKHGFLNIHGSLLPKYRGAAPIQWALVRGEQETGITIMQTDVGWIQVIFVS